VIDFHIEFDQRFSDQNRILIFISKSIRDEKTARNSFHSRSNKSGSNFCTKIDQRFPDQNRIAIFMLKSDPEFIFSIAIAILIKNRSGKIGDRFSW